jgi:hypothetical protein
LHGREFVGGGAEKLTSVCDLHLPGERRRVIEQVLRNVAKNDPASRVSQKRAKRDEAITAADIKESAVLSQPGIGQDSIPYGIQVLQSGLQTLRIAAMPAMQQPLGPDVCRWFRHQAVFTM